MNELLRQILFLPEQASSFAREVDQLHFFVLITTMVVSTAVGLTGLLLFVRYRRSARRQKAVRMHPPWWVEALFVSVPLAFFLTWFAMGYRDFVMLQTPPREAMDIYVMGKQWMWKYSYPEGPSSIGTLRVPVGRPVRLLLTSRDVIHSFYVPAFRVKQDAIPGRYTQTWFTAEKVGRFQVLCTEYCGAEHSLMRGEVIVMDGEAYDAWMDEQKRGLQKTQDGSQVAGGDLASRGELLAVQQGCLRCHTTDGTRHIGPTWLDLYGREEKLEGGQTVRVDEAYLTASMMDPALQVVAGFKPVMPSFRGRIAAPEAAALIEYIKTLRSARLATEQSEAPAFAPTGTP